MAKQVMESRLADKVSLELTAIIKRKVRHDDKSIAGNNSLIYLLFMDAKKREKR